MSSASTPTTTTRKKRSPEPAALVGGSGAPEEFDANAQMPTKIAEYMRKVLFLAKNGFYEIVHSMTPFISKVEFTGTATTTDRTIVRLTPATNTGAYALVEPLSTHRRQPNSDLLLDVDVRADGRTEIVVTGAPVFLPDIRTGYDISFQTRLVFDKLRTRDVGTSSGSTTAEKWDVEVTVLGAPSLWVPLRFSVSRTARNLYVFAAHKSDNSAFVDMYTVEMNFVVDDEMYWYFSLLIVHTISSLSILSLFYVLYVLLLITNVGNLEENVRPLQRAFDNNSGSTISALVPFLTDSAITEGVAAAIANAPSAYLRTLAARIILRRAQINYALYVWNGVLRAEMNSTLSINIPAAEPYERRLATDSFGALVSGENVLRDATVAKTQKENILTRGLYVWLAHIQRHPFRAVLLPVINDLYDAVRTAYITQYTAWSVRELKNFKVASGAQADDVRLTYVEEMSRLGDIAQMCVMYEYVAREGTDSDKEKNEWFKFTRDVKLLAASTVLGNDASLNKLLLERFKYSVWPARVLGLQKKEDAELRKALADAQRHVDEQRHPYARDALLKLQLLFSLSVIVSHNESTGDTQLAVMHDLYVDERFKDNALFKSLKRELDAQWALNDTDLSVKVTKALNAETYTTVVERFFKKTLRESALGRVQVSLRKLVQDTRDGERVDQVYQHVLLRAAVDAADKLAAFYKNPKKALEEAPSALPLAVEIEVLVNSLTKRREEKDVLREKVSVVVLPMLDRFIILTGAVATSLSGSPMQDDNPLLIQFTTLKEVRAQLLQTFDRTVADSNAQFAYIANQLYLRWQTLRTFYTIGINAANTNAVAANKTFELILDNTPNEEKKFKKVEEVYLSLPQRLRLIEALRVLGNIIVESAEQVSTPAAATKEMQTLTGELSDSLARIERDFAQYASAQVAALVLANVPAGDVGAGIVSRVRAAWLKQLDAVRSSPESAKKELNIENRIVPFYAASEAAQDDDVMLLAFPDGAQRELSMALVRFRIQQRAYFSQNVPEGFAVLRTPGEDMQKAQAEADEYTRSVRAQQLTTTVGRQPSEKNSLPLALIEILIREMEHAQYVHEMQILHDTVAIFSRELKDENLREIETRLENEEIVAMEVTSGEEGEGGEQHAMSVTSFDSDKIVPYNDDIAEFRESFKRAIQAKLQALVKDVTTAQDIVAQSGKQMLDSILNAEFRRNELVFYIQLLHYVRQMRYENDDKPILWRIRLSRLVEQTLRLLRIAYDAITSTVTATQQRAPTYLSLADFSYVEVSVLNIAHSADIRVTALKRTKALTKLINADQEKKFVQPDYLLARYRRLRNAQAELQTVVTRLRAHVDKIELYVDELVVNNALQFPIDGGVREELRIFTVNVRKERNDKDSFLLLDNSGKLKTALQRVQTAAVKPLLESMYERWRQGVDAFRANDDSFLIEPNILLYDRIFSCIDALKSVQGIARDFVQEVVTADTNETQPMTAVREIVQQTKVQMDQQPRRLREMFDAHATSIHFIPTEVKRKRETDFSKDKDKIERLAKKVAVDKSERKNENDELYDFAEEIIALEYAEKSSEEFIRTYDQFRQIQDMIAEGLQLQQEAKAREPPRASARVQSLEERNRHLEAQVAATQEQVHSLTHSLSQISLKLEEIQEEKLTEQRNVSNEGKEVASSVSSSLKTGGVALHDAANESVRNREFGSLLGDEALMFDLDDDTALSSTTPPAITDAREVELLDQLKKLKAEYDDARKTFTLMSEYRDRVIALANKFRMLKIQLQSLTKPDEQAIVECELYQTKCANLARMLFNATKNEKGDTNEPSPTTVDDEDNNNSNSRSRSAPAEKKKTPPRPRKKK